MKQRILLIEDNNEIRENTAEILELSNYSVDTAENGKVGIEKALLKKPDLIICDIMMPVLDGYGVLHLLNKNEQLAGIPFIFLTAKSERGDMRKGMEMGADDYISKPFTDIELLNAIDSRLKKIGILKKEYASNPEGLLEMLHEWGGKNALQHITENREENHYRKKQTIYFEGNHPQKLFFIKHGKVKTFISNEEGKGLTIGLYATGDFFGYTALLEGGTYKETAEAMDDSVVAEIPINEFQDLLQYNPEAAKKIIQLLAKNITEKEQQLLSIAYNSLRKRVATALITLLKKYGATEKDNFSINFSREDLANIAGTATESLIRTLSDFKSEKLIEIQGSRITILNEKKLSDMLN
jgi:CRP/FNR family transcriptional regulator, cyclic AMP receptor protein